MRRAIAVRPRGTWPSDDALDAVTLAYLDRHRRRIRLVCDLGEIVLLDLPRAHHLADGDGLELDTGGYIRVRAAPEPVLEIAVEDSAGLLRIAWHLGNRHLPMQVTGGGLRIRADAIIADMVTALGGRITAQNAAFDPEAGAYAGGPAHETDHH
jgi:urease accessory protein